MMRVLRKGRVLIGRLFGFSLLCGIGACTGAAESSKSLSLVTASPGGQSGDVKDKPLVDISAPTGEASRDVTRSIDWYCYSFELSKYLPPPLKGSWPWDWSGSFCYSGRSECNDNYLTTRRKLLRELKVSEKEIDEHVGACEGPREVVWCYGSTSNDIRQGSLFCARNAEDCQRDSSWDWRAPVTKCMNHSSLKNVEGRALSCTNERDDKLGFGAVCGISGPHCERDALIWRYRTGHDLGSCKESDAAAVWCGVVESPSFRKGNGPDDRPVRSLVCADGQRECDARVDATGRISKCVQEHPGR